MAQAVALLPSATAVTARGMDQAPSDDQREERRVNPLLYALAAQRLICHGRQMRRSFEKRLPLCPPIPE